jgi:protein O-mannosyl-transferase
MARVSGKGSGKARQFQTAREATHSQGWWSVLFPAVIAMVTFATFVPALSNDFVNWDDDVMLVDNPFYRGLGLAQLRWMFSTFLNGHFQPLSWLTLGLDYLIWGTNPFGYHLTSLIIHAANAVIFYFVCRLLFTKVFSIAHEETGWQLDISAALAAALFALHPLRVESVVWATERRDVLSGGFFLTALYCYLRANAEKAPAVRLHNRWLLLTFVAQLFSLLAKATAITLPLVLVVLDIYPLQRLRGVGRTWRVGDLWRVLWEKLPFLLLSLVFGVVALMAQHAGGALRPVREYFLSYRLGQAFYGVCFYFWKTLVPIGLSPLYELPYDFNLWAPPFIACATTVVLVSLLAILMRRHWPWAAACWAYYVIVLAPVLGIAQSGPQLVADRYSYLACLSWAVLLGGFQFYGLQSVHYISTAARAMVAAVLILVSGLGLSFSTVLQVSIWHDSEALWTHALRVTPNTAIAAYNLGKFYETTGKPPDESVELYRRAVSINPTYADAHYNLARLLAQQGKPIEASSHYREALKFRPNDAEAHNNLGQLLAMNGDVAAALMEYRQALALEPKFAKAYFNLGRLFVRDGAPEKAIDNFQQALKLEPRAAEVHVALADAYAQSGSVDDAIVQLDAALKLRPDLAQAQDLLARLLAAQGRSSDAERHSQAASGLMKSNNQNLTQP